MTNTPDPQDYSTQESANEHPNLDTIYAYTKDFLEKQNQGIDAVDRKIATIFLFGVHITIEDLIKPENMGWIQPVIQSFDRLAHSLKY